MSWLWALIVGGLIGLVAGAITKRGGSMGLISNIIAGLVGSALGEAILGAWGPQLAGMAIIPFHHWCGDSGADCFPDFGNSPDIVS